MYPRSYFEMLPLHVLEAILERLDPRTLLYVGQCSRTLNRGAHWNWRLWARVLKLQCIEHGVFLPTYPINFMHIPNLQRAAFRIAYLWDTAVRIQEVSQQRILHQTVFWKPVPINANPFHILTRVEIIPGGRYVLGLSMKQLTLYDLTGSDVRYVWPYLSALDDLNIQTTDNRMLSLEGYWFPPEGSILRVLVEVSPAPEDLRSNPWHMVYEIDVGQQHPQFRPVGSMILEGGIVDNKTTQEAICGDLAAIYVHRQSTMVIWDFIHNRCATWKVRSESMCAKLVLTEGCLTQYTMDGVYQWPIPPLESFNKREIHMPAMLVHNKPSAVFPLPDPDIILNKVWYRPRPGSKDLLPDMAMIWSNKSLNEAMAAGQQAGFFITVSRYRKDKNGFSSTRVCIPPAWMGSRRAMSWSDDGDIEWTGDKRQIYSVSLCPYSGRLAGIRSKKALNGNHIYELAVAATLAIFASGLKTSTPIQIKHAINHVPAPNQAPITSRGKGWWKQRRYAPEDIGGSSRDNGVVVDTGKTEVPRMDTVSDSRKSRDDLPRYGTAEAEGQVSGPHYRRNQYRTMLAAHPEFDTILRGHGMHDYGSARNHNTVARTAHKQWGRRVDDKALHKIYFQQMLQKGYGLPCWNPDLTRSDEFRVVNEGKRSDVVPGDVGILAIDGRFHKLFNIWEKSSAIGSGHTDTSDYPLPPQTQTTESFDGGEVMTSSGIHYDTVTYDEDRADYLFHFDDQAGAILAISSPAQLVTLDDTEALENYVANHAEAIFHRAGRLLRMGTEISLIIVTGSIRTSAWAIAALEQRGGRRPANNTLSLMRYPLSSKGVCYEWINVDEAFASSGLSEGEGPGGQTVFIQGFQMKFSRYNRQVEGVSADEQGQSQPFVTIGSESLEESKGGLRGEGEVSS
ncbi:hypothetical protein NMY22_g15077 [Coprinellus aureogranulatus]|nr:hypothetical protein NMY22_g15077 [Coprinellus aureogranulatus]